MFDIFGAGNSTPSIAVEKIESHIFVSEVLQVRVTGRLIFCRGDKIIIRESESRLFDILIRGEKSYDFISKKDEFDLSQIAFFTTEQSQKIKKELTDLCESYFATKEEK